jgi:hypothetical protein
MQNFILKTKEKEHFVTTYVALLFFVFTKSTAKNEYYTFLKTQWHAKIKTVSLFVSRDAENKQSNATSLSGTLAKFRFISFLIQFEPYRVRQS